MKEEFAKPIIDGLLRGVIYWILGDYILSDWFGQLIWRDLMVIIGCMIWSYILCKYLLYGENKKQIKNNFFVSLILFGLMLFLIFINNLSVYCYLFPRTNPENIGIMFAIPVFVVYVIVGYIPIGSMYEKNCK